MSVNKTKNDKQRDDEMPEVGENFEVWYSGHLSVDCVSHNDDGSIGVRMPDGELFDADWDGIAWAVCD